MFLDDSETDAQAEARAFADRLGGVKGIENAVRLLDAWTCVRKQDDHVAAVAHGFNRQHTALMRFHGVNGVADEVEKNLQELIAVAAHSGENGFKLQPNACGGRTKVERAKLYGIVHHGVDIE